MNNLEISKDVYFDCSKKQLNYCKDNIEDGRWDMEPVNRYVIVREEIKRYKELILTTDMGKKMKDLENIK